MKLRLILLMVAASLIAPASSLSARGQNSYRDWSQKPAPPLRVSGRVIDPTGRSAPEAIVTLILREPESGLRSPFQSTAQTDAQGNFTLLGVVPGSYLLSATWSHESKDFWSQKRIEVADSNVTGVQLQLRGPLNFSGRVRTLDGTVIDLERLTVEMSPEDGQSPDATADVEKDGAFAFHKIRPITYLLQLSGLPEGWYTHSAVLDAQDALNNGIDLAEEEAPKGRLEIAVSPGAGRVEGVVSDPEFHDFVPGAVVKLIPDPASPRRTDLSRTALTNQFGEFTFRNVVPGQYRVLAVMVKGFGEGVRVGSDGSSADYVIARHSGIRIVLDKKQSKYLELELFEGYK